MKNDWVKRIKINSVDCGGYAAFIAACVLLATGVIDWQLFLIYVLAKFTFVVRYGE